MCLQLLLFSHIFFFILLHLRWEWCECVAVNTTCNTCIHEVSLLALDEFILLFLQQSEHKLYRLMRFSEGDAHATTLGVQKENRKHRCSDCEPVFNYQFSYAMTTWWPTETMRMCFDLLRYVPKIPPVKNVLLLCYCRSTGSVRFQSIIIMHTLRNWNRMIKKFYRWDLDLIIGQQESVNNISKYFTFDRSKIRCSI